MAAILMMAAIGTWAVETHRISYVVTHGVSMNPLYYQGDLVVVCRADSYRAGEIVAYRGSGPGLEVLHRIVGGDAATGYVFKGDNNRSIDGERPTSDHLIGRAVLHVPKGGIWLKPILSPTGLGMMGFLIVSSGAAAPRNRREVPRGRRKKKVNAMQGRGAPVALAAIDAVRRMPIPLRVAACAAAVCGMLGLILGALGWTGPLMETGKSAVTPRSLTYSYSAPVPRSAAYDGMVVSSPDPVFRKLAKRVNVRMRYRGPAGRFASSMTLTDASGWHSTMPLVTPTSFAGTGYDRTITLDLKAIDDRERAAAAAIGVQPTATTIVLSARVDSAEADFTAPLQLALTPLQLSLPDGAAKLVVDNSSQSGTITTVRHVGPITAAAARAWAAFLLVIATFGAIGVVLAARRTGTARTRAQIERRYPQLLVHVEPMASPPGKPVVNVDNFPALVKLAERYGQMILTWRRPDADDFVVRDEGITYRYRVPLDEPDLQNVELIDRPSGVGSHRRRAASEVS